MRDSFCTKQYTKTDSLEKRYDITPKALKFNGLSFTRVYEPACYVVGCLKYLPKLCIRDVLKTVFDWTTQILVLKQESSLLSIVCVVTVLKRKRINVF